MTALMIQKLRAAPLSERPEILEELIVEQFKRTLLMNDDDELPTRESFFEIGLTSLRITEIKQRIEELVGRDISANVLFNRPTVEQLLDYLVTDVLADLFTAGRAAVSG